MDSGTLNQASPVIMAAAKSVDPTPVAKAPRAPSAPSSFCPITACTFAALTTCLVIVLLFLEVMGSLRIMWLVGLTFMLSTLALVISLALFLREVHLATYTVRIAQHSGQTRF